MLLTSRYLSSLTHEYIALGTKSKLFDPTFSNYSELIIINLKTNEKIKREMNGRFNDILVIENMVICALEQEMVIYRVVSMDDEQLDEVDNSKNTRCLECVLSIKMVVNALSFSQKRNMLLLAADKLILLDLNTVKSYNVGITGRANSISYNKKVNHIIAASIDNQLLVYDIKKKEEVVDKKFSNLKRVEWHPHTSMYLFIQEDGLSVLDLSNDKITTICLECTGFLVRDEFLYIWDQSCLRMFRHGESAKVQNVKTDLLIHVGDYAVSDLFHFNTNDRLAVISLLSGSTMILANSFLFYSSPPFSFALRNNVIFYTRDKEILRKQIHLMPIKVEKDVHELLAGVNNGAEYECPKLCVQDDEIAQLILEKRWDEIKCRHDAVDVPLAYFLDEDKKFLMDNLKLLLLICVKESNYRFLIENNVVDYKYLLKYLNKEELGVLAKQLAGKVPFDEIARIYEMAGDKKMLFKIKFDCIRKLADQMSICDVHGVYLNLIHKMKEEDVYFEDEMIDYFLEYARFVNDKDVVEYLEDKKGMKRTNEMNDVKSRATVVEQRASTVKLDRSESTENVLPRPAPKSSVPEIPLPQRVSSTPIKTHPPTGPALRKSPIIPGMQDMPDISRLSLNTKDKKLKYSDIMKGRTAPQSGFRPVTSEKKAVKPPSLSIPKPVRSENIANEPPSVTQIKNISEEFNEDEINELDSLIQKRIADLREKSAKKKGIIFKARIKDGLQRVGHYKKITNPNILPYLRIFKEEGLSYEEFLKKSQALLNFSEVKMWLEGILNLWKIVD
ncbi:putative WD40/YVTN repeat-like-containing domain, WD40 repeat-like-containing domain protein [Trachipleistophora hominis]|uniref:Putative WD40/YVTN repeat-like-containing domain, WD40 repeat-like-containing domain protein n=1 Tax=Trachipleistophora hominis TaxID=72359 RepID=L7JUP3_TRAHO|nr:putative WD40/YVTN repeat-like-containing domain, WD40 repeat-like-containing domain protein [Trachipleistophora hominis]